MREMLLISTPEQRAHVSLFSLLAFTEQTLHSGDRGGDSPPGAGVGLSPKGWQMHRGPPHTGSSSLQLWAPQGGGHTPVSGGKEKTWRLGTPRSPPCLTGADTLQLAAATHPQPQQPVWDGAGTILISLSNLSSAPPDCGCPSGHPTVQRPCNATPHSEPSPPSRWGCPSP